MFLWCFELVQITKASSGEKSATFQESSIIIPFPEHPLQRFECSCSHFF